MSTKPKYDDDSPTGEHVTLDATGGATSEIVAQENLVLADDDPAKGAAVALLEAELGFNLNEDLLDLIDVIPDPYIEGMFFMRFRNIDGPDAAHYLMSAEGVEQVEFTSWPPRCVSFEGER